MVAGTGTDVGKTWVSARLLATLRAAGSTVAARKPAQSFGPADDPAGFDSAVLGAASGETSELVCHPSRWYGIAMAPPMAADALGRSRITLAELVHELAWPEPPLDVGLVETAGGVRSPQGHDGDVVTMAGLLAPDIVLLVADAGLGTLNMVRLSVDALPDTAPVVVVLNRYDQGNDLHERNRRWLVEEFGFTVVTMPGGEETLASLVYPR
jgi:dethiobiotin synthetase